MFFAEFARMGQALPIERSDLAARFAKLGVKDISSVKTELYPPIEPKRKVIAANFSE